MKNPLYADKIVLRNGGVIETEAGTDIISVDSSGSITIEHPTAETITNLTATGNTVLGDAAGDTVTVTGTMTVTPAVTLTAGIAAKVIFAGTESIAAGGTSTALSLTKTVHLIDADAGGDTFTLADGTAGQIMTIAMLSSTGTATITPTNLAGGTSVTFNAAGDTVVLQFIGTKWYILGGNSYAIV